MRVLRAVLCVAVAVLCGALPHAQEPGTDDAAVQARVPAVLKEAAGYVAAYAGRIAGMVVEEAYVQDAWQVNRFGSRQTLRSGPSHRALKSDVLLVRPTGADAWMQFRDVFEVDGRPVRDRNDRLQKLFVQPSKSTAAQAEKIIRESARYNIGDIERTVNIPLLAMTILDERMQGNFQFKIQTKPPSGVSVMPKSPAFAEPPGATILSFDEISMRTMVTTPQGRNMRSRGRFWLSTPWSEVLMTELRIEDYSLTAVIHVVYGIRPDIKVRVPIEMHEMYETRASGSRVEGTATYSNYREFNVKVDEQIKPVQ